MKKLKVMTIVGTRPEIIRLSRVIHALDNHCDHILVHTGQNYDYELNEIFFKDLEIRKPNHFLESASGNAAKTIGNIIPAVDRLLAAPNNMSDDDAWRLFEWRASCARIILNRSEDWRAFTIREANLAQYLSTHDITHSGPAALPEL